MVPDEAVTLIAASRRYQIASRHLQFGMFVAELDRPWLDTPFLLQGFLADSQVEIDTLRRICGYVYVDLELSNPEVADAIRRSEMRESDPPPARVAGTRPVPAAAATTATPVTAAARHDPPAPGRSAQRVYRTRSDVRISSGTRARFRQLVRATAVAPHAPSGQAGVVGRALDWLRRSLRGDRVRTSPRKAAAARDAIQAWLPPGVVLTRYEEARPVEQELPRARQAFRRGEDVMKSLVADVRIGKLPQVAEVSSAVDDMIDSIVDNPDALMWVGRLRNEDIDSYHHGVNVALYLLALGRQLGFPRQELSHLGLIGMLADVGKIRLPRALLDKPGMLSPAEFGLIKEHVRLGLEALADSGALPPEVVQGIAQHHERLDGSGYPKGLRDEDISLYGRMAAIADSFAALITPRAYANASSPQDAMMNLYEWSGSSFHEALVEQFVQAVGVFPVGSMVELSNGEVAVVVAHNRVRRLEPRVLVLTTPEKAPLSAPIERDLLALGRGAAGRLRIVRGLPAGAYGLTRRDYYMGEIARAHDLPG